MATEILKTLLKDITPKKWYDSRIPDRYAEIVKLASEKISPESASVFAEPKILESAYEEKIEARWFIPDSMAGAVPVSSLLPAEQKKAVDLLNARVGKIVEFGNALLLAEKPENIRWGQLLLSACSCPSLDYVYAKDDQVVMTAWGFNFKPDANASGLVTVGTNPKPEIVYPFEPEKEIQNPPEVIEEPKKAEITDVEESPVINDISEEQATPPPVIPPKKDNPPMLDSKSIFDWWKWLKYLLWFLLLLLLILLLSRGCNGGYGFLVDPESEEKEEVVNPPGTNPPGTNPPGTNAPGTNPPGTNPPGTNSPGTNPPGTNPPGTNPPGTNSPGTNPPGTNPPRTNPPGTNPPGTNAPGTNPPGTNPPGTNSPGTNPPGTNPPGTNPPGTNLPGTNLPGTNPPGTNPPGTNSPGTNPPGTNSPGTNPPGTNSPGTNPPGTNSPGINPPGTNPPGTNPPGYIKPVEVKLPCQDYQSRLDKLQDEINKLINDCNNRNN